MVVDNPIETMSLPIEFLTDIQCFFKILFKKFFIFLFRVDPSN